MGQYFVDMIYWGIILGIFGLETTIVLLYWRACRSPQVGMSAGWKAIAWLLGALYEAALVPVVAFLVLFTFYIVTSLGEDGLAALWFLQMLLCLISFVMPGVSVILLFRRPFLLLCWSVGGFVGGTLALLTGIHLYGEDIAHGCVAGGFYLLFVALISAVGLAVGPVLGLVPVWVLTRRLWKSDKPA